ncbi:hypothetical protein [Lysobacter sp. CA199]|uniref:hypothetical protein n=1 Tax=Lysobacter sp. CA199 TaxID=3455608 RepID=UPI003F8D6A0A
MQGIAIHDSATQGVLALDLRDLLACLDDQIGAREWSCHHTDVRGPSFEQCNQWSASGEWLPASRLIEAAQRADQVVGGDFYGRRAGEVGPSLIIKAVDSSYWEVFGDAVCLNRLRARFDDVRAARYAWDHDVPERFRAKADR